VRVTGRIRGWGAIPLTCLLLLALPAVAQDSRVDQVLDRIIANEQRLAIQIQDYQPLVETYLQTVKPDPVLGRVPIKDNYFFGKLVLPKGAEGNEALTGKKRKQKPGKGKSLEMFTEYHSATFKPERFAQMLLVDRGSFRRENYDFDFVRTEFLGEVRTLVFDVTPKAGKTLNKAHFGRFSGRIWAEDQDYQIVRFNGIYGSMMMVDFHFDSWRMNLAPGMWLPAYVYTEEPDRSMRQLRLSHQGQTRLWGYDIARSSLEDAFTKVMVETVKARDDSESPGQISPVEAVRSWVSEAEDNVIQRLERAGLVAPPGEVDKVLATVVQNLEITNELNIQPPVRCRVLLTTPLESFTVGHTIVLSRGLIDVLPDEASLAMVLGHEMGHILNGHKIDTRFAFTDQVIVGDKQAMEYFNFQRDPEEELEADNHAVNLLQNSPYAEDLSTAGLFLRQLEASTNDLPALIRPHFGSRIANRNEVMRMNAVIDAAPPLDHASMEQTAALPLGGRVKMDPWSAEVSLMKNNRVPLLGAHEKLPLQVTPLMPYLTRYKGNGSGEIAENRSGQ